MKIRTFSLILGSVILKIGASFDTAAFFNAKCQPSCILETRNLTSGNVASFPKSCDTLCSDMAIDEYCDLTEEQLTDTFRNVKHLVGSLIVISTKYTSLKFLAGLESIECGDLDVMIVLNPKLLEIGMTNLTTIKCSSIDLSNNKALARLNWPNLKNMSPANSNDTSVRFKIDSVDKNFCITTQEMYNLMDSSSVSIKTITGMFCEPASPVTNGKVCDSPYTLIYPTNILDGCTQYFGSLVILPENEKDVAKLKTVEAVFGPLYIARTNLTKIDFFDNLKYVSTLGHDTPAIKVENNKLLTNFSFPSLKRVQSMLLGSQVRFDNNSQILTYDPSFCRGLEKQLNFSMIGNVMFDNDQTCLDLENAAKLRPQDKSSWSLNLGGSLVMVVLAKFIL